MKIEISGHAKFAAERRNISINMVEAIAENPQQIVESGLRIICQSILRDENSLREMLYRLVVEDIGNIRKVITVYKTSKIDKYWEGTE